MYIVQLHNSRIPEGATTNLEVKQQRIVTWDLCKILNKYSETIVDFWTRSKSLVLSQRSRRGHRFRRPRVNVAISAGSKRPDRDQESSSPGHSVFHTSPRHAAHPGLGVHRPVQPHRVGRQGSQVEVSLGVWGTRRHHRILDPRLYTWSQGNDNYLNIAKGTTDPRVEFILAK